MTDTEDEFVPFPLGEALLVGALGWSVVLTLAWWFIG